MMIFKAFFWEFHKCLIKRVLYQYFNRDFQGKGRRRGPGLDFCVWRVMIAKGCWGRSYASSSLPFSFSLLVPMVLPSPYNSLFFFFLLLCIVFLGYYHQFSQQILLPIKLESNFV